MKNHHHMTDDDQWRHCTCCGHKIKVLGSLRSLSFFMGASSAQRRGFQCANCGQITCYECSATQCRCTCNSNAWIALPYLDSSGGLPLRGR